jgi:hypothetical protein
MNRLKVFHIVIVSLFILSSQGLTSPPPPVAKCGVERWAVKTCSDKNAGSLFKVNGDLKKPRKTTIAKLIDYDYPFEHVGSLPKWSYTERIPPVETSIWVLEATMTDYKLEDDRDYHIVLEDEEGFNLVAEIPNPSCVATKTLIHEMIDKARDDFNNRFQPTAKFKSTNVKVRVTGVGFFDKIHGQKGVADNGVEIHPVLKIEFLD